MNILNSIQVKLNRSTFGVMLIATKNNFDWSLKINADVLIMNVNVDYLKHVKAEMWCLF